MRNPAADLTRALLSFALGALMSAWGSYASYHAALGVLETNQLNLSAQVRDVAHGLRDVANSVEAVQITLARKGRP